MSINMLMFEMRNAEREYFEKNTFEDFKLTFFDECLDEEFVKTLSSEVLENTNVISIFNNCKDVIW